MSVDRAIARGRRRMAALETVMVEELLRHYGLAWLALEREIDQIGWQIAAAVAQGEEVSPSWLGQQAWWQQVQDSIAVEMGRFSARATTTVTTTQAGAVRIAQEVGAAYRTAIGQSFQGQVWGGAMERWVSMVQPDSPLGPVLDRYGQRARQAIETRVSESFGTGEGFRTVARKIAADVGPDAVEGRLTTLVRTEGMRAYRGAGRDDMEALAAGMPGVHEWEWLAALGNRTCVACLAMHRKRFRFDEYPDRFHVACRCTVILAVDESIVPRVGPAPMTGEEWLRSQSEDVQREILGPTRFEAFQSGAGLDEFVGVRSDPVWGDSVYVRPLHVVGDRTDVPVRPLRGHVDDGAARDGFVATVHPEIPVIEGFEDARYRAEVPEDLMERLGGRHPVILTPTSTVAHVAKDHPVDLPALRDLNDVVAGYEWWEDGHDGRVLLYTRHHGVWTRTVIAPGTAEDRYPVVVSVYRRDERKVTSRIRRGLLRPRGSE